MCLQKKTNENEEESSHNKTADERAPQDASKAQRSTSGGTSDSAENIHTGPIAYSRSSVRSTSEAENKEGDDAAKNIAEAEKNKMEETRKLKQQRAKEAIKNKRAKAQLAKDNQALRDEHEKS